MEKQSIIFVTLIILRSLYVLEYCLKTKYQTGFDNWRTSQPSESSVILPIPFRHTQGATRPVSIQDCVCCDYFYTPVNFQVPDTFIFVGGTFHFTGKIKMHSEAAQLSFVRVNLHCYVFYSIFFTPLFIKSFKVFINFTSEFNSYTLKTT